MDFAFHPLISPAWPAAGSFEEFHSGPTADLAGVADVPGQVDTLLAGRYRLTEALGSGGSATVYRGSDTLLDRPVAVKVFHEHGTGSSMLARQHTEMLFLAKLNHPNLVSIFDAHIPHFTGGPAGPDSSYLVMEFVDGMSLAQRLACTTMTLDESADIGRAVASALRVVHGHGLVHRDVKPANILLPATGGAKLADFGIARLVDSAHLTVTAEVVGTPLYLSPEQASGGDVGSATDIYSLGLVLLECLTGSPEFPGTPVQSAIARLLRDPQVPIDLPPPWPDLLRSMTSPVPAERPTADAVTYALTTFIDDRNRCRTAATIRAPGTAHRTDDPAVPRIPAAAGGPDGRVGQHIARQRIWELTLLVAGFALALIGVFIAVPSAQRVEQPTDPPTTSSTAPSIDSTAAKVAATSFSPPADDGRRESDLAVNANIISVTTETVTTVSTLSPTSIVISETPSSATTATDTSALTPIPTPETITTISEPASTPSATTSSSDARSTDIPSIATGTTTLAPGSAVSSTASSNTASSNTATGTPSS